MTFRYILKTILIFSLFILISNTALADVFRADPQVKQWTTRANREIRAQVYEIDHRRDRVRFKMSAMGRKLTGGTLEVREGSRFGRILLRQNYRAGSYAITSWVNLTHSRSYKDFYIKIRNHNFYSGRMRLYANDFDRLNVNNSTSRRDLKYDNQWFYYFWRQNGVDYQINLQTNRGNANLYTSTSQSVTNDTYQSRSTNGGRSDDYIHLRNTRSGYTYISVYGNSLNTDYEIAVNSLPKLSSPRNGSNVNVSDLNFRWSLADDRERTSHYLKIRDLNTNRVVYQRSIGTRTSIRANELGVNFEGGHRYRWVIYYRDSDCVGGECVSADWTFNAINSRPRLSNATINYREGAQYATPFVWRVRYTDSDGNNPSFARIKIYNPKSKSWFSFNMQPEGGSISQGRYYNFSKTLDDVGQYRFQFEFSDGSNTVRLGPYDGPVTSSIYSAIKLERGVWFRAEPIVAGEANNIDGQFRFESLVNSKVKINSAVLAIHRADNNQHVLDLRFDRNITLNGRGDIWNYDFAAGTLHQGGRFKAVAKIMVTDSNGRTQWFDLSRGAGTKNPHYFSVIEDREPPIVEVTQPAGGGARWNIGSRYVIRWRASDVQSDLDHHRVLLYVGNSFIQNLSGDLNPHSRSFSWTVPNLASGNNYRIRVQSWDTTGNRGDDYSDNFSIGDFEGPTLRFLTALNGVEWEAGSRHLIEWTATDNTSVEHTTLNLYKGNELIERSGDLERSRSFNFRLPDNIAGNDFRFKLSAWDRNNNSTEIVSPQFTIRSGDNVNPDVEVLSPSEGGEILQANGGHPFTIRWNASDRDAQNRVAEVAQIRIHLLKQGNLVGEILGDIDPQSNSFEWRVPDTLNGQRLSGNEYKLRVTATDGSGNQSSSESEFNFSIARLRVSSPAANTIWINGQNQTIRWNTEEIPARTQLRIALWDDHDNRYELEESVPNTGSYNWNVGNKTNGLRCHQCRLTIGTNNLRSGPNGNLYDIWNRSETFTINNPPPPPPPPGAPQVNWNDIDGRIHLGDDVLSELSKEPVNLATGNYFYKITDLEIPGRGINFFFERNYNSKGFNDGPIGHKWTHTYNIYIANPQADVLQIYLGDGREENYRCNEIGICTAQIDIKNTLRRLDDQSYTLTYPNGMIYGFNSDGTLSYIADRRNNRLSMSYANGHLSLIRDTVGREIRFEADQEGRITRIEDPIGRVMSYAYNDTGNLISFTNAQGDTQSYTYDEDNQLITLSDFEGNILTTNIYEDGRVVHQTEVLGEITLYDYDIENRRTIMTDAEGHETTYQFDERLRSQRVTDALGFFEEFAYDQASNRIRVRDKNDNVTLFTYDERGNLLSRTDALEQQTFYTYDNLNNVTEIRAPGETVFQFTYNQFGELISERNAENHQTTYTYNDHGLLIRYRDARGHETQFRYDDEANLTEKIDALGNTSTYEYDDIGRILVMSDPRGNETEFSYDANDQITSITDALGHESRFTYTPNKKPLSLTDKRGASFNMSYNDKSLLISIQAPLRHRTNFTYDLMMRRTSIENALEDTQTIRYDAVGNAIEKRDYRGHVTRIQYDGTKNPVWIRENEERVYRLRYDVLHRLISTTDPLLQETRRRYNERGHMISITDGEGHTTNYRYNKLGWLLEETDPLGHSNSYTYDENGNLISLTDKEGHNTTYTYDALNRLSTVTDALNQRETYTYDENSNLILFIDKTGLEWTYVYDSLNRLIRESDPDGNTKRYQYDQNGNLIIITDAEGHLTQLDYDSLNRIIQIRNASGDSVTYEYDALGRKTAIINPLGHRLDLEYDANGNLVEHIDVQANSNQYTYDEFNNLIRVTRPSGEINQFSYDFLNRMTAFQDNGGNTWSYTYNANNQITSMTDPLEQTQEFTYDERSQLSTITLPEHPAIRFTYNARGQRVRMTDQLGDTNYTYDPLGRLSSMTNPWDQAVAYQYTPRSQVARITYPDNRSVNYTYNSRGLPSSISNLAGELSFVEYTARDLVASVTYPNLSQVNYIYDEVKRLQSINYRNTSGNDISVSYTYNSKGDIISETYEGLHLDMELYPAEDIVYTYDENGRLSSVGDRQYVYDAKGQRIQEFRLGEQAQYTYDARGLLTQVSSFEGEMTYSYNGHGQLVQKESAGQVERYAIDINRRLNQILSISDSNGDYQSHYEYLNGLFSKERTGLDRSNFVYDNQGNTFLTENNLGALQNASIRTPFGQKLFSNREEIQSEGFSGRWGIRQETQDLHFMRARFYDARSGQFLNRDPIMGHPMNPRRYNAHDYVMNQPKRLIDPTGMIPEYERNHLIKNGCYTSPFIRKELRCDYVLSIAEKNVKERLANGPQLIPVDPNKKFFNYNDFILPPSLVEKYNIPMVYEKSLGVGTAVGLAASHEAGVVVDNTGGVYLSYTSDFGGGIATKLSGYGKLTLHHNVVLGEQVAGTGICGDAAGGFVITAGLESCIATETMGNGSIPFSTSITAGPGAGVEFTATHSTKFVKKVMQLDQNDIMSIKNLSPFNENGKINSDYNPFGLTPKAEVFLEYADIF